MEDKKKYIRSTYNKYQFKNDKLKINYRDRQLDDSGINYRSFIKLHSKLVDKQLKNIGENGLYVLFYICTRSDNRSYLKTTIPIILSDLNISRSKLEATLSRIQKENLIHIRKSSKGDKFQLNEILEIIVVYDSEIYDTESGGYKALPIDYLNIIIGRLTPIEFSVLMILCIRFRYNLPTKGFNEETGMLEYGCQPTQCAFPKLEDISNLLKRDRKSIKPHIVSLAEKKLISYKPNGDESYYVHMSENSRLINPNYMYRIEIFQRVEYMYYNYFSLPDTDRDFILGLLNKKGFEYVSKTEYNEKLLDKDYIRYAYKDELSQFEACLMSKDKSFYDNGIHKVMPSYPITDVMYKG